ncbi:MAG: redoxin domain-containing protein [Panacagrimonas sp.]
MGHVKSIFLSLLLSGSIGAVIYSKYQVYLHGLDSPWIGTAIACSGFVLFIALAYLRPRPRTSRNLLWVLALGLIGTAMAFVLERRLGTATLTAAVLGIVGDWLYIFWYSRFDKPGDGLREGAALPALQFMEKGQEVRSQDLTARPALWIFYRGNWCPLCVAQVREVAAQYTELARRGVDVFLVSPQSQSSTESLAKRFEAPMRFLVDVDNRAATTLGIVVRGGLPAGFQVLGFDSDVPRPTVFITAAGGQVLWCDVSENYRVRPEPAALFHVLDRHAIV